MNGAWTEIRNAKFHWKHFFLTLLLECLLTSLLYILIIPITYWGLFGEGEKASRIMDKPLHSFIIEFGALTFVLSICVILAFLAYGKSKISETKSYILTSIIIFVLYVFRFEIGDFIIELF